MADDFMKNEIPRLVIHLTLFLLLINHLFARVIASLPNSTRLFPFSPFYFARNMFNIAWQIY